MFIDEVYNELLKKLQIFASSQTEEKSESTRFWDKTFYIKFNIVLVLKL
jgi:hypothetical protein